MSFSSSIGDSAELEGNLTLGDRLKVFKSSNFDPNAYFTSKCQTMNEKEIRHLCSYLVELKKASAEEMRKSVYANYSAFIRTSKEISALEGQLLSMRNLLSTQAALIHGLAEGAISDALCARADDSTEKDTSKAENRQLSKIEDWLTNFLETLEVLLAERRVDEALAALEQGESVANEANDRHALTPTALISLKNAITEQRQKLADQLAETTRQPSTRGVELRSAVLALKKLGDGPRAHTLLLSSHHQKLQSSMQNLRASSASYRGAYAAALSQLVFSTIAQAASDSLAVFSDEPAYSSELVSWAVKQTEAFALLLKRHVLASSAASGDMRVAADCMEICLGHCSLLEVRGLALSPVLLRLFRLSIEQALSANLKRIEQSSAALAAGDDWLLLHPPVGARPLSSAASLGSTNTSQPKLSASAHKFNSMVQEFLEDVGPLESLQLDSPALEGVLQVFNSYVNLLINALPGSLENEENLDGSSIKIVKMAETEAQQIALLANASLLADELLPRAAMKLLPLSQSNRMDDNSRRASDRQSRLVEQREWKRRLQRSVDRLRDSFCRQHALDLIFAEDGDVRLNPYIYTSMDGGGEEPEWFPSPVFQELFAKLTRMASLATDMFVGRERFATVLLMRLTETVILWLSNDQGFWEEIEEGPKPLGPLGLQQLYLDMEFVLLFTSQGRYLSRNLHTVIKNIIGRAIEAVSATGIDPYSVLPDDENFAEVAQIAIKMLTGKANFGTMERDVTSPTASLSAKSVSSVHSHGSN
ncbi:exocyst complex component EXO84A [Tripterygium wilfordii]|uniref:Exocyst complex component EXO84A n=1 Tax=Tripterygium wilfordii TaxID=458696 RepID=A0A7J7DK93_TRIWF|nr:exocyst complex component EXO84A [Tripterygium wilfordii]KAF5746664.1 exocyst complex component EXO84A [Tripterygium wilfordii]